MVLIVLKEMLAGTVTDLIWPPQGVVDEGKFVFFKLSKLSTLHLCTSSQTSVISRYTHGFLFTSLHVGTTMTKKCRNIIFYKILLYNDVHCWFHYHI